MTEKPRKFRGFLSCGNETQNLKFILKCNILFKVSDKEIRMGDHDD